jgi:hypothetical protein
MKTYQLVGFVLMSILCVKCSPALVVNTDYDREADFSQYQTFYWSDEFQQANGNGENNEPLFYNTLVKKRLKQAIQRELEGKGYTLSASDPDLLVNAQVVVEERNTRQNYPYYGGFYYWGFNNIPVDSEKEGDIVIDLIDQNQHQLVWQGYASGVLDMNTKDRQQEINDAVSLILSEYNHRADEQSSRRE